MGGFPLDSWSTTSVHIARGNMRLDLKILLDLGARALAIPNRACFVYQKNDRTWGKVASLQESGAPTRS
jgi:hypothetical protein